jgi:hypothetical protein
MHHIVTSLVLLVSSAEVVTAQEQLVLANSLDLPLYSTSAESLLVPREIRASLKLTADQCRDLDRLCDWYREQIGTIIETVKAHASTTTADNLLPPTDRLQQRIALDLLNREVERRIADILSDDQLAEFDKAILQHRPSNAGSLRTVRLEAIAIAGEVSGSDALNAMRSRKSKVVEGFLRELASIDAEYERTVVGELPEYLRDKVLEFLSHPKAAGATENIETKP